MDSPSLARRTAGSWLLLAWALACTNSEPAATPTTAATPTKTTEPTKAAAPSKAATPAPAVDGKAAEPTPAAPPPAAPSPAAPTDAEPTPVPPVIGTDVAPPIDDPAAAPNFAQAPTLASETITSTPTTVSWREVARPEASVELEPVTRGVLARSSVGFFDVDSNGALVLRKEIEAPKGPVLGIWPDNAWVIERRTREHKDDRSGDEDRQIRLVRLRGKKRWVPQEYHYEQRFDDRGEDFAMGAKIGMLVKHGCDAGYNDNGPPSDCDPNALTRVADSPEDPEMGESVGGELTGFFETRSGEIYTARVLGDAVYLQRDCADAACVAANVRRLPDGRWWSFERPIARQKHSVSVVATVSGTPTRSHVLHYEATGWKLESLEAAPKGLWPLDDGGLWTQVGDTLLHRDPAGSWRAIELPDGASAPSIAVSGDGNEVWLAAQVGGNAVVFATAARAQQPVATPTPAAP